MSKLVQSDCKPLLNRDSLSHFGVLFFNVRSELISKGSESGEGHSELVHIVLIPLSFIQLFKPGALHYYKPPVTGSVEAPPFTAIPAVEISYGLQQ